MKTFFLVVILLLFVQCDIVPTNYPVYKPTSTTFPSTQSSGNEFKTLWDKDQINKKKVNAEVLTFLLNDPDPKETHTAAVFENASRCDIIVRMVGISTDEIYNLPIRANSKNQFVVKKGNYTLKSSICSANYYSQKNVTEPLILKLSSN